MKTFLKLLLTAGAFVSGSAVDCEEQFRHDGHQCTGCHPQCTKMCGKSAINSQACGNACISEGRECSKTHGTACNCEADCSPKCNPNVCQLFSSLLLPNFDSISHLSPLTFFFFLFFSLCFTEILPMWQRLHPARQGVSQRPRLCLLCLVGSPFLG